MSVIFAGGGGELAISGGANDGSVLKRGGEILGVVFEIPAVAEEHEGKAGGAEIVFGGEVFGCQREARGVGAEQAGVGEELDVGGAGGVDDGLMLRDAGAELVRGDEQDFFGSGEGSGESFGAAVVGFAKHDTKGGEVGCLVDAADRSDDLRCGDFLEQGMDDVGAEFAGCSCDDDHLNSPFRVRRQWRELSKCKSSGEAYFA